MLAAHFPSTRGPDCTCSVHLLSWLCVAAWCVVCHPVVIFARSGFSGLTKREIILAHHDFLPLTAQFQWFPPNKRHVASLSQRDLRKNIADSEFNVQKTAHAAVHVGALAPWDSGCLLDKKATTRICAATPPLAGPPFGNFYFLRKPGGSREVYRPFGGILAAQISNRSMIDP